MHVNSAELNQMLTNLEVLSFGISWFGLVSDSHILLICSQSVIRYSRDRAISLMVGKSGLPKWKGKFVTDCVCVVAGMTGIPQGCDSCRLAVTSKFRRSLEVIEGLRQDEELVSPGNSSVTLACFVRKSFPECDIAKGSAGRSK